MSKNYTQKTAALKTTTHETRNLDAQQIFVYPGDGLRGVRKDIIEIISEGDDAVTEALNTNVKDIKKTLSNHTTKITNLEAKTTTNEENIASNLEKIWALQDTKIYDNRGFNGNDAEDLWSSTITVETHPESGIKTVFHNGRWIAGNSNNRLASGEVKYIQKNRAFVGEPNDDEHGYTGIVNVELDKVVYDDYCTWIPAASVLDDTKIPNLLVASNTQSKTIHNKSGKSSFETYLPSVGYALRTWYKFSTTEDANASSPSYKLPFVVYAHYPKLTIAAQNFAYSNIKEFYGDYDILQVQCGEFMQSTSGEYSLEIFEGSLSNLLNGDNMFRNNVRLTHFTSDLGWLATGKNMFDNTQLSVDSVRNIAYSLPYIKSGDSVSVTFSSPVIFNEGVDVTYSDVTYSYGPDRWTPTIGISWNDLTKIDEEDRAIILYELFPLIVEKGWTITTNLTSMDSGVMAMQRKYFAKVQVSDDERLNEKELATHKDDEGNLYYIIETPVIYGNDEDFEQFTSLEVAETTWELTKI